MRWIILSINPKLEVVRGVSMTRSFVLENSINENLNHGSIHVMDDVESEPSVVNVMKKNRGSVICEGSIIHSNLKCTGSRTCSKHLHHAYTFCSTWHVSIPFKLPYSTCVIMSLQISLEIANSFVSCY